MVKKVIIENYFPEPPKEPKVQNNEGRQAVLLQAVKKEGHTWRVLTPAFFKESAGDLLEMAKKTLEVAQLVWEVSYGDELGEYLDKIIAIQFSCSGLLSHGILDVQSPHYLFSLGGAQSFLVATFHIVDFATFLMGNIPPALPPSLELLSKVVVGGGKLFEAGTSIHELWLSGIENSSHVDMVNTTIAVAEVALLALSFTPYGYAIKAVTTISVVANFYTGAYKIYGKMQAPQEEEVLELPLH